MKHRALAVLSLLVVPGLAAAQRSQATRHTPLEDRSDDTPSGPTLRGRDIEDHNPLKALIDKRKDLKLTDDQVNSLKTTQSDLKKGNEARFKAVDSLVREMRPPLNPTTESRVRSQLARQEVMATIAAIDSSYNEPAKSLVATLDAEQQSKAAEILSKAHQEAQKDIRQKLGGGRGRP
jgi:hypothetical protein